MVDIRICDLCGGEISSQRPAVRAHLTGPTFSIPVDIHDDHMRALVQGQHWKTAERVNL